MPKYKIARIASDIQRYLGEILINEVNDEILKSITITGCDVTNDLSYCKIYFTSIMDMDEKSLEKEVNEAAPFIRGKLSEKLEIRHTPELKFIFDKSILLYSIILTILLSSFKALNNALNFHQCKYSISCKSMLY